MQAWQRAPRPFDHAGSPDRAGSLIRCDMCVGRGWLYHAPPADWPDPEGETTGSLPCPACDETGALALPPSAAVLDRLAELPVRDPYRALEPDRVAAQRAARARFEAA
jgi:hypothetical protein